MMKQVIDRSQMSEMGNGWGHYELPENINLMEVLGELRKSLKSWGKVTIYRGTNNRIRCFDFNLYNDKIFYHHLTGTDYNCIVREVKFTYCYMSEDIDIYVEYGDNLW